MDHKQVIREIIEHEVEFVGAVALRQLKSLPFITVDTENEEFMIDDDVGRHEVKAVVDTFRELQGSGAVGIARHAVANIIHSVEDEIDLPAEIIPEDVKEEQFVSGF